MPVRLKERLKKAFPGAYARWLAHRRHPLRAQISRILASAGPAVYLDSDEEFDALQNSFPPYPDYGYDAYSCYRRGVERSLALFNCLPGFRSPGAAVLEIGCADAMVGAALALYGHTVTLVDLQDRRDNRAKGLAFLQVDVCEGIPLKESSFDAIYSYNTLEHIADPRKTLRECVRLCKPGGRIYFEFGPLYASAWGLHAYNTLRIPYAQFLFSLHFIEQKLNILGINDLGEKRAALQPMNQWRLQQFTQLWQESGCVVESVRQYDELGFLDMIRRFPGAFAGRGLTYEDVTRQSLFVLLRKP